MKRILMLVMALVLLLPLASSCQNKMATLPQPVSETETEAAEEVISLTKETETAEKEYEMIPQSEREKKVMKILIIGNSHSNDVFFQLARVFHAQGYEQPYVLGFLYFSGCKLSQHVGFLNMNKPVYDYYTSSETSYVRQRETTMKYALEDQQWDVIFLHPGGSGDLLHEDLQLGFRRRIEDYVNQHVPTEHVFAWHMSWPNPDEEEFFSESWWRQPPAGYKQSLIRDYGFDPINQHTLNTNTIKENILSDPTYQYTICTGAGIMYANQILGVSQFELYRDYTHLSDFGRVLAAYCFYAQFTGKPIEEVKLDLVPAAARQSHYTSEGDLVLTEERKEIIKECANYALENPWSVPGA